MKFMKKVKYFFLHSTFVFVTVKLSMGRPGIIIHMETAYTLQKALKYMDFNYEISINYFGAGGNLCDNPKCTNSIRL